MNDYFISRLPAGHPVKDFKAAATVALRNEGTMVAPPEAAVPALRRQCAALEWVLSEVFTLDNVEEDSGAGAWFPSQTFRTHRWRGVQGTSSTVDHVAKHPLPAPHQPGGAGCAGGGGADGAS